MSITQAPTTTDRLFAKPGRAQKYLHGVWFDKNRKAYVARLHMGNGKKKWLGLYPTEREAGLAYDRAARELRPEAVLNFPLEQVPPKRSVVEDRIMTTATAPEIVRPGIKEGMAPYRPVNYTFGLPNRERAAFEEALERASETMSNANRSEILRTAAMIGMDLIVNPPAAPETPTPSLPDQTIRNLAMLGSLLVAIRRMPQVAGALTETIESHIDAISRDLDAISAFLDA